MPFQFDWRKLFHSSNLILSLLRGIRDTLYSILCGHYYKRKAKTIWLNAVWLKTNRTVFPGEEKILEVMCENCDLVLFGMLYKRIFVTMAVIWFVPIGESFITPTFALHLKCCL